MDLDEFDHKLLAILKVDARQTGDQLAEHVGLSPASCLRRVQRLRNVGAIEREVAILSPEVEGNTVTILAFIELTRGSPYRIRALREKFQKLPEVDRIYHVTGTADLVLVLRCASMEAYATFTEAHFYAAEIKGFESTIVLRDYSPEI